MIVKIIKMIIKATIKITIHLGASENSGLQVKFSSIGSPGYFASGLSSE